MSPILKTIKKIFAMPELNPVGSEASPSSPSVFSANVVVGAADNEPDQLNPYILQDRSSEEIFGMCISLVAVALLLFFIPKFYHVVADQADGIGVKRSEIVENDNEESESITSSENSSSLEVIQKSVDEGEILEVKAETDQPGLANQDKETNEKFEAEPDETDETRLIVDSDVDEVLDAVVKFNLEPEVFAYGSPGIEIDASEPKEEDVIDQAYIDQKDAAVTEADEETGSRVPAETTPVNTEHPAVTESTSDITGEDEHPVAEANLIAEPEENSIGLIEDASAEASDELQVEDPKQTVAQTKNIIDLVAFSESSTTSSEYDSIKNSPTGTPTSSPPSSPSRPGLKKKMSGSFRVSAKKISETMKKINSVLDGGDI